MKRNKSMATRVCPFTLEPLEDCRMRKVVFNRMLCPFSVEACLVKVDTMQMIGVVAARRGQVEGHDVRKTA